jgi:hypothetical protein
MVRDMHGFILVKGKKTFYADIVTNRQLEVVEKYQNQLIKVFVCSPQYLNVPIHGDPREDALK